MSNLKCQGCIPPDECDGEVEEVHLWDGTKDWGKWTYCRKIIMHECQRGFQIYDSNGNLFEYIPEQLNRIPQ